MNIQNIKIEKEEGSMVSISAEVAWEELLKYEEKATEEVSKNVKIDGFREGKIPKDVLEKKVGEMPVLEEMAYSVLNKAYPQILVDNKIDAIGRPQIQLTKLARGNSLGFTAKTAVYPEIKLPDYKKIAAKINKEKDSSEITQEEIDKTIEDVRQMYAKQELMKKMQDGTAPVSDVKDDKNESKEDVQKRIDEKLDLPELDDDFVKKLGAYENVEDFKVKLEENMKAEKIRKEEDKNRLKTVESLIEKTEMDLPEILVEVEVEKTFARMKADIEKMGMKLDEYLKNIKKEEGEMRKEMRSDAEKRAKMQILVHSIAKEEKLTPDPKRLEDEMKAIKEAYKDVDEDHARGYIESVLINDEVFKLLASQ